jgi:hypothetical protein
MGLALCHPSDAKNSEVTTRFSANLWTPVVSYQSPIDRRVLKTCKKKEDVKKALFLQWDVIRTSRAVSCLYFYAVCNLCVVM